MTLFTKKQAAERLGCSTVTIDKLRRLGKLPCHKIGALVKFTQEDIDEFVERSAVPAQKEA
ncbi:MAG: helix-turn-helix domain-containing protein [Treponema sp.]|nr:helix-turn-helix domain-containing protein [Treponema sp.]